MSRPVPGDEMLTLYRDGSPRYQAPDLDTLLRMAQDSEPVIFNDCERVMLAYGYQICSEDGTEWCIGRIAANPKGA